MSSEGQVNLDAVSHYDLEKFNSGSAVDNLAGEVTRSSLFQFNGFQLMHPTLLATLAVGSCYLGVSTSKRQQMLECADLGDGALRNAVLQFSKIAQASDTSAKLAADLFTSLSPSDSGLFVKYFKPQLSQLRNHADTACAAVTKVDEDFGKWLTSCQDLYKTLVDAGDSTDERKTLLKFTKAVSETQFNKNRVDEVRKKALERFERTTNDISGVFKIVADEAGGSDQWRAMSYETTSGCVSGFNSGLNFMMRTILASVGPADAAKNPLPTETGVGEYGSAQYRAITPFICSVFIVLGRGDASKFSASLAKGEKAGQPLKEGEPKKGISVSSAVLSHMESAFLKDPNAMEDWKSLFASVASVANGINVAIENNIEPNPSTVEQWAKKFQGGYHESLARAGSNASIPGTPWTSLNLAATNLSPPDEKGVFSDNPNLSWDTLPSQTYIESAYMRLIATQSGLAATKKIYQSSMAEAVSQRDIMKRLGLMLATYGNSKLGVTELKIILVTCMRAGLAIKSQTASIIAAYTAILSAIDALTTTVVEPLLRDLQQLLDDRNERAQSPSLWNMSFLDVQRSYILQALITIRGYQTALENTAKLVSGHQAISDRHFEEFTDLQQWKELSESNLNPLIEQLGYLTQAIASEKEEDVTKRFNQLVNTVTDRQKTVFNLLDRNVEDTLQKFDQSISNAKHATDETHCPRNDTWAYDIGAKRISDLVHGYTKSTYAYINNSDFKTAN